VLDVRCAARQAAWHVAGSARLPAETLARRGAELPPAGRAAPPLLLLLDSRDVPCAEAVAALMARAPPAVRLGAAVDAGAAVGAAGEGDAGAREWLAARGYAVVVGPPAPGAREAILWRASPMLGHVVEALLAAWAGAEPPSPHRPRLLLDAGCGAGRNAVALAAALRDAQAGACCIAALDNRGAMVARCAQLAHLDGLRIGGETPAAPTRPLAHALGRGALRCHLGSEPVALALALPLRDPREQGQHQLARLRVGCRREEGFL